MQAYPLIRGLFLIAALPLQACKDKASSSPAPVVATADAIDTSLYCAGLAQQTAASPSEGFVASTLGLFHAKIEWKGPLIAVSKAHEAQITITDPQGLPAPLSITSFKLFMPAMGHGTIKSSQLTLTRSTSEPNIWTAAQIYFSMGAAAGEWVVDLEAGACDTSDKVRIPVLQEVE